MRNVSFLMPSGVVVIVRWDDGTMGSRSVPWADLKRAGEDALVEAINIVAQEIPEGRPVAVSRGHGNIFWDVVPQSGYTLSGYTHGSIK